MANGRKLQGKVVRWGCDNWEAGKIVKLGSMKEDCHAVALRIEELCRKWNIRLETLQCLHFLSSDEANEGDA